MYEKILDNFVNDIGMLSQQLYISLGSPEHKASIKHIKKSSNIKKDISFYINKYKVRHNHYPSWVKIDFVVASASISINDLLEEMLKARRNYIDFGISFDKNWIISFLPEVINANAFIRPQKNNNKEREIAVNNINYYLSNYTMIKRPFSLEQYTNKNVIRFETQGYLLTSDTYYELESKGGLKGVRKTTNLNEEIDHMITTSTSYLKGKIQDNGKYEYGVFPHFNRKINFYNILRHCSSTYALIEGLYYLNQDIKSIFSTFEYIHKNAYYDCGNVAYIYDNTRDVNEIKLGQNAAYIFAVVEYIKSYGPAPLLLAKAQKVAKGILSMINFDNMETTHVLNYPNLSVKEQFRIIYYDGETALALLRLYQIDQNPEWLDTVKQLFDKFIDQNYWQYHDHWLGYCSNEIMKIAPDERYLKFGLKNVSQYLDYIYNRETTFPTFLEMLTSTYQLVQQVKKLGFNQTINSYIDEQFLIETIHHRANYQRAGYFYPEIAMYFKNPKSILGSFFIKHHGFRIRIDDIEHYLSGYIQYLNLFGSHSTSNSK